MTRRGRPMKYFDCIKSLEYDCLYSPAAVADHGAGKSLLREPGVTPEELRERSRGAMIRFAADHLQAREDGLLTLKGSPPARAWFGWRWMLALDAGYFTADERGFILEKQRRHNLLVEIRSTTSAPAKLKMIRSITVVAVLGLLGLGFALNPEWNLNEMFRSMGSQGLKSYFQNQTGKSADAQSLYGLAWGEFYLDRFQAAEKLCNSILGQAQTSAKQKADCFYLLGLIETRTGRLEAGHQHLTRALEVYEALEKFGNSYRVKLALAELAVKGEDYGLAEALLDEARWLNERAQLNRGRFNSLKMQIHFWQGDYEAALQSAYAALGEYEKLQDPERMAGTWSGIGFFLILNGDPELGLSYTLRAQNKAMEVGSERIYYYNLVNFLLLSKCEGSFYGSFSEAVQRWCERENNQHLLRYLTFVESYNCGDTFRRKLKMEPQRVGAGTPDPPGGLGTGNLKPNEDDPKVDPGYPEPPDGPDTGNLKPDEGGQKADPGTPEPPDGPGTGNLKPNEDGQKMDPGTPDPPGTGNLEPKHS